MKTNFFAFAFLALFIPAAFCGGDMDLNLVNEQEINLGSIDTITVRYSSENISLLKSNTDSLVLKEYMNKDKNSYYAKIINSGNELIIEAGHRDLFNLYRGRIEIFIPESSKNISIKTSSGDISADGEYTALSYKMESSSGNITVNTITADNVNLNASSGEITVNTVTAIIVNFKTSSGNITANAITANNVKMSASSGRIRGEKINGNADMNTSSGSIVFDSINGNISASSSSGSIELSHVNGTVNARSSSGGIRCTAAENAGDISIVTTSGSVVLGVPQNLAFNFSSRTSSGGLRTPFQDKLFIQLSDKNTVNGIIDGNKTGENQDIKNINIRTSSGSIRVEWAV